MIKQLRDLMRSKGIDAAIFPQTDPHQSEYIADHWQVRRWLSGFTGSAGALVVTPTEAYVWADSRYWLQAAAQLSGTGIAVMEEGKPEVPAITEWICSRLTDGQTVGIHGMLFSIDATEALRSRLGEAGIKLDTDFDAAGELWTGRPALPDAPIFVHDVKYAGEEPSSKIAAILAETSRCGANAIFISDLAEIAWTLNIRSRDVKSNPVAISFLSLSETGSTLLVDPRKLTPEVIAHLDSCGIATQPYDRTLPFLAALPDTARVLVSPSQTAGDVACALGKNRTVRHDSPVAILKGCKNETQIEGIRQAMRRDGAALVKAFMHIEADVAAQRPLTEMGIADLLTHYRSQQPLYFDQSFDTIAGYGPHGAIVHYSATPDTDARIRTDNLLLIDSGANYLDGTTDITRTVALGQPTERQRTDFTLVMKGHIALAAAVYPEGTRGAQLDALARQFLWQHGLSYLHGTGHGVGHFLNVHEGPQSIRLNENPTPLRPGMITSDEPGLYREGEYGIRCENLVLTVPAMTTEFGRFLKFETLTLFPFDRKLFDLSIMTPQEIQWVNEYHDKVRRELSPLLSPEENAWLTERTMPL